MARAERGERIIIARDGKAVAQLGPTPKARRAALSPDDSLLNLNDIALEGAGGSKAVHEARVLTAWMNAAIGTIVGHHMEDAVSSVAHEQSVALCSCLEGLFGGDRKLR